MMKNFKYLLTACLVGASFAGVAAHAESSQSEGRGKAAALRHHLHGDFIHFCFYEGASYSEGSLIKAADTVLYCHAGKAGKERKLAKHAENAVPTQLAKWMTQEQVRAAATQEEEAKLPVPADDKKASAKEQSKQDSDDKAESKDKK